MKSKTIIIIAGLLAAAGGVSAIAAVGDRGDGGEGFGPGGWGKGHHGRHHGGMRGEGGHGGGRLLRLDTDKDGDVTLAEFLKPRQDRFAEFDTNKDGVIDAAELTAYFKTKAGNRIEGMLKRLDANGDGKISREEFALASTGGGRGHGRGEGGWGHHGRMGHHMGGRGGMMDRMGDQDGPREGRAGGQPPERQAQGDAPQADKGAKDSEKRNWREERQKRRAAFVGSIEERFKALDTNGDGFIDKAELEAAQATEIDFHVRKTMHDLDRDKNGKISQDEYLARAKERFARLDLNDDGKITAEDLPPSRRGFWKAR